MESLWPEADGLSTEIDDGNASHSGPAFNEPASTLPVPSLASTAVDRHSTSLDTVLESQAPTLVDSRQPELPDAALMSARRLLRHTFRRCNEKESVVICNYIGSKRTWRWQCCSQPPLISLERKTPSSGLAGWLSKNRASIHPEPTEEVQAHTQELQVCDDLLIKPSAIRLLPSKAANARGGVGHV